MGAKVANNVSNSIEFGRSLGGGYHIYIYICVYVCMLFSILAFIKVLPQDPCLLALPEILTVIAHIEISWALGVRIAYHIAL